MFPPGVSYQTIGSGDVAVRVTDPCPQRALSVVVGAAAWVEMIALTDVLTLGQAVLAWT